MLQQSRILVTGAAGQLGRLVVSSLVARDAAHHIVGITRRIEAAAELEANGIEMQVADYAHPESLKQPMDGVERLLIISADEVGQRVTNHRNVIEAAKAAGVKAIVYTSLLHADTSPLSLAGEHLQTEAMLADSGIPYVVLRNGWYTENDLAFLPVVLAQGMMIGASGDGRFSWAARRDYAEAAAVVLTGNDIEGGRMYELAGDIGVTRAELADEISRQSGRPVQYKNLSASDYRSALVGFGLPEVLADVLTSSDTGAAERALYDDRHDLSRLIGRSTTPLANSVADALKLLANAKPA